MPTPRSFVSGFVVAPVALVVGLALCAGCNRRVFEYVEPACGPTDIKDVELGDQKTDILIVVDNSGSMLEEQAEVARNFLSDDPACPIATSDLAAFARCDDDDPPAVCRFHNPTREQLDEDLATCGFLQVLAAFDTDFRVGVITTDVGACDNRFSSLQGGPDWGHRPQRGCLQPDTAFGSRKIIARDDVDDADPAVSDIGARFRGTLDNIRTFGTGTERGLDAVDLFFADDTVRDASCAGDRDAFLRDDARLVVVFVSDEEDCSSQDGAPFTCAAGDDSCVDRFANFGDDECADLTSNSGPPGTICYRELDQLTPVSVYADRFRALKDDGDVTVVAIAGGVTDDDGNVTAGGCNIADDGAPEGGCTPLAGQSRDACPDCCLADGGGRYFALADELGGTTDSICFASFRKTMIDVAAFVGGVDVVRFSEKSANPAVIIVEKEGVAVARLDTDTCGDKDGWFLLENNRGLQLCGSARPAAGEKLKVRVPLAGLCAPPL